jgi:excisionase family DNA binding protein
MNHAENATVGPTPAPALIDVIEVARQLGCSPRHVSRLVAAGRVPKPVRLGHLLKWRRAELESWLAGGCATVAAVSN